MRNRCILRSSRARRRSRDGDEPDLLKRWDRLLQIRSDVNAGIEVERKEKHIGSSLGAHVELNATGGDYELLEQYETQLPMFFIVSGVTLRDHGGPAGDFVDSCVCRFGCQVRTLLAVRVDDVDGPGTARHLRSLPGRVIGSRRGLMTSIRSRIPELWIAAAIVVMDQATKALVKARLPLHDSVTVIPGFFDLTHVRNTGAAFGMLNSMQFAYKPAVMVVVALVALGAVASYALTLPQTQRIARYGLALILGGAAGNLIDRATLGYVVDFVDVYWRGVHFWAFNVADSAITVGVVLMLLDVLGVGRVPETV